MPDIHPCGVACSCECCRVIGRRLDGTIAGQRRTRPALGSGAVRATGAAAAQVLGPDCRGGCPFSFYCVRVDGAGVDRVEDWVPYYRSV